MDKILSPDNGHRLRKRTLALVLVVLMAVPVLEMIMTAYMERSRRHSLKELIVAEDTIQSDFVSNDQAGPLFVITGMVRNQTEAAANAIRVRVDLFSEKRKLEKSKTAYCGNILSNEDLKTASVEEIDSRLENRNGIDAGNAGVEPGGTVPFMIVFAGLPRNLVEYEVRVDNAPVPAANPPDSP
jgi:hypothetical protein